jgi:hypothetical protein
VGGELFETGDASKQRHTLVKLVACQSPRYLESETGAPTNELRHVRVNKMEMNIRVFVITGAGILTNRVALLS